MRVAGKLVVFLVAGMVLIVAIEAYASIHQDLGLFQQELELDARQLGRALGMAVKDVWRKSGRDLALRLIEDANESEPTVDVRWVWLDAPPGDRYRPQMSQEHLKLVEAGSQSIFQERDRVGHPIMCYFEPVTVDAARRGGLELSLPADAFDEFRRHTIVSASIVAASAILTSAFLAVVLGTWLIGVPLRQLIEKNRRIGAGDLSGPLLLHRRDEFTELAAATNEMCDQLALARDRLAEETKARIAAIEQVQHADRLATVGRLAAGMAHELGTPMNVASARAASIIEEACSEEASANAAVIKAQIDRMTTIIRQILVFSRRQSLRKAEVELTALIAQTADLLAPLAKTKNVAIRRESASRTFAIQADAAQLQQVLSNLLTNAIDAMPAGGTVKLEARRERARPPGSSTGPLIDCVRIDVTDEGAGITDDDRKRIFDPFFTTKDVGHGTGLGLSIAYGIVLNHGGWIDVSSRVGAGSCFSVFLPVPRDVQDAAVEASPADQATHAKA